MNFSDAEIREFIGEANDLLDVSERSLIAIDQGADFKSQYDEIFRAFHSIKGAAGMMEMHALQSHMHNLENILTKAQEKSVLSKEQIDFFLRGVDAAREVLSGQEISFDYNIAEQASAVHEEVVAETETRVKRLDKAEVIGKVFLVDDEPDLVSILSDILDDAGFETRSTSDPLKAAEMIAAYDPDVVLSDVKMPKMTGLELLAIIHGQNPDLPVVFVSGYVEKSMLIEALSKGIYGVVEKPFDDKKVVEVCITAAKRYQLIKLLNRSLNLLLYQFSDLDEYLAAQGKDEVRKILRKDLDSVLEQRRELRSFSKLKKVA